MVHRGLAAALTPALALALALAACGAPPSPLPATAHAVPGVTPATAETAAPPPAHADPYCASSEARQGMVDSVRLAYGAVSFCVNGDPQTCARVHLDTGAYEWAGAQPPDHDSPVTGRPARNGRVLDADGDGLTVCTPASNGPTHCQRVIPGAYDLDEVGAPDRPFDLSPDGDRLLFVRKRPQGSAVPVAEVYSVAANRLLGRAPITGSPPGPVGQSEVAWLGRRFYASLCAEADGRCAASLVDPATGRATALGIDTGAEHEHEQDFFPVQGSSWAFVSRNGDAVVWANVDDGTLQRRLHVPAARGGEAEVVPVAKGATLVLVYQQPVAGDVAVVDLARAAVVRRMSPPACAGAEDAPPSQTMKLRAAPAGVATWPSRICAQPTRTLVVENDCGCNDALKCEVVRAGKKAIDLRVRTDPTRPRTCNDCFPMVPARCELPSDLVPDDADAPVTFKVRVNGAPAIDALGVEPGSYMDFYGCTE
jgi:hypothetical protein